MKNTEKSKKIKIIKARVTGLLKGDKVQLDFGRVINFGYENGYRGHVSQMPVSDYHSLIISDNGEKRYCTSKPLLNTKVGIGYDEFFKEFDRQHKKQEEKKNPSGQTLEVELEEQ